MTKRHYLRLDRLDDGSFEVTHWTQPKREPEWTDLEDTVESDYRVYSSLEDARVYMKKLEERIERGNGWVHSKDWVLEDSMKNFRR